VLSISVRPNNMTERESSEFPEPTGKEKAHSAAQVLVKGVVGAVPVAGSFLAEIVGVLYRQPIDKRREEWLRDVASALNEIRAKQEDLSPEKLAQNEESITVLHRATESACGFSKFWHSFSLNSGTLRGG
jgi:hypothetical protein